MRRRVGEEKRRRGREAERRRGEEEKRRGREEEKRREGEEKRKRAGEEERSRKVFFFVFLGSAFQGYILTVIIDPGSTYPLSPTSLLDRHFLRCDGRLSGVRRTSDGRPTDVCRKVNVRQTSIGKFVRRPTDVVRRTFA